MNLTEIIGYGGALLVIALGLLFTENLKNLAKVYFSNRSKKQIDNIFYVTIAGGILLFLAVAYLGGFEQKTNTVEIEQPTPKAKTPESEYIDAAKEIYDITTDAIKKKKHKDSIFIANKEKIWAYQIGTIKKRKAAWELYEKVKDIEGISFFKISRRKYLVVIYNGNTEEELNNTLNEFSAITDSIGEKLKVINMTSYCSKKEKIVEQEQLRNRKKKYQVRLYECEK